MRTSLPIAPVLLASALLLGACAQPPAREEADPAPRNVIFLLGDGMGHAHVKAYRTWADDPATHVIDPLPFDSLLVGAVATEAIAQRCSETDPEDCEPMPYGVTDSAASATAYASGRDTLIGMLGQGPDGERYDSVLHMAARQGKATGVVSTSQVTHASPAAFVVHAASRQNYPSIANQFYDNQVNGRPVAQVILGGGTQDFRRDDRDVARELVDRAGYTLVEDRESLLAADADRLLGLFAPIGLPRQWDRPDTAPTLADMTRKAVEILSRDEDGFFLVVEGSQIDWSAHGQDIAGVVSEMEGFTEAVEVALAFAGNRDDTLVVITADHETGGLSLGRDGAYEWDPQPLRGLTATPAAITATHLAGDGALSDALAAHTPFELTEAERTSLDAVEREEMAVYQALNAVLNERTHSGWTTYGHTAVDVPIYATGPGSDAFRGTLENEAVGQALIQAVAP